MPPTELVVGWDIGGAHLKACRLEHGRVTDIGLWACPLWQGLEQLGHAFSAARARWPDLAGARHAVTMTGEMADAFADREQGVRRIAACAAAVLPDARFYAGSAGWCEPSSAGDRWPHVASANWIASASWAARHVPEGIVVDIGSTTSDFIALRAGRVASASTSDAERLASGELLYHGVVRTPLCAVARRIAFRGVAFNLMNEFFASAADVYRTTGELDPAHDLHPSADGQPKDAPATRQRLARMVGLDARDATPAEWLAFAQALRAEQLALMAESLERVAARHGLPPDAPLVPLGCGAFLAESLAAASGRPLAAYLEPGRAASAALASMARVCAPSVAVAALLWEPGQDPGLEEERRASCG